MVHVMTKVLQKIHGSLRKGWLLLNIQPSTSNYITSVKYQDELIFSKDIQRPNFIKYLEASELTFSKQKLFEQEGSSTDRYTDDYSSVDEWLETCIQNSKDKNVLLEAADQIRKMVSSLPEAYSIEYKKQEIYSIYRRTD